MTFYRL